MLTVAELHEYKANRSRAASGVCLEAEVQQGRGVVAKVMVQKGTLHVGDVVVCGEAHGRIKAMYDTLNPYKKYKEAGPSMPVNLTGLDVAPPPETGFTHWTTSVELGKSLRTEPLPTGRRNWPAGSRT